ncbi:MAG: hypothetical protein U0U70_00600 [Chitinophagaceae bacterium]
MKLLILLLLSTASAVTVSAQKGGIKYEKRTDLLKANDCNPSEVYIKKKVKAQLANFYAEYPEISVDFTSFKGQNGYNDKNNPSKFIYPYKIEMLVYLRRKVTKEGKELTENYTWKYDAVYEYATLPGKKCEFRIDPSSQITRIHHQIF